jgi:hypothetical protein
MNLVGNAMKFTEQGVTLSVIAGAYKKKWNRRNDVKIIDTPIPQNQLEKIFESFTQVNDDKKKRKLGWISHKLKPGGPHAWKPGGEEVRRVKVLNFHSPFHLKWLKGNGSNTRRRVDLRRRPWRRTAWHQHFGS